MKLVRSPDDVDRLLGESVPLRVGGELQADLDKLGLEEAQGRYMSIPQMALPTAYTLKRL